MNSKKKNQIVISTAALFCAATLALFGISGEKIIEAEYNITQNETNASMEIIVPNEYSFDIVELLLNGQSVTKTVLPDGKLTTIPFIFSDLSNCELRFSRLGEVVAIGNFKDDKLYIAIKDNIGGDTKKDGVQDDNNTK